jgi:hypothetical protein
MGVDGRACPAHSFADRRWADSDTSAASSVLSDPVIANSVSGTGWSNRELRN